ncbi:hypothetical protein BOX15_Mlig022722g1, partial [Macrostomum lignano]
CWPGLSVSLQMTSTLTVRLIRSFEFKNVRNLVLHSLDLDKLTVAELKGAIRNAIATSRSLPPTFKSFNFDTLKIHCLPQAAKPNDLVVNVDNDEALTLSDDSATLSSCGLVHEAELSYFNQSEYCAYKANPVTDFKW